MKWTRELMHLALRQHEQIAALDPHRLRTTKMLAGASRTLAEALRTLLEQVEAPITDEQALAATEERESHRYKLLGLATYGDPIRAQCSCGWVGPYAREWGVHRERAALEAARKAGLP